MSTSNFHEQKNFDLYVQSYELSKEDFKKDFFEDSIYYKYYQVAETDNERKAIFEKAYEEESIFQYNICMEDIICGCDGFKDVMEEFNDTLLFHNIDFKSGYYEGIQLYIEEKENPHYLDNEDCRYYFDLCRSVAIRKYKSEINKINKWMGKVATQYGWRKLNIVARFSNGETWYKYAS